ncbi:MAG: deoxynucleoside kinase [Acetilactobacillus jinshanensis]
MNNNPVLPLFYKGNQLVSEGKWKTNPYTFLLQIYFLNIRFKMMKQAMKENDNVLDRSIYEDRLFMKMNYDLGNTTKPEWDIYQSLLANMMEELPYAAHKKAPDLMVLIKVDYPTMLKRIEKRGRPYEQPTKNNSLTTYYKNLIKYYAVWAKHYDASPLLIIDGNQYDFMGSHHDLKIVLGKIDRALKKKVIIYYGSSLFSSTVLQPATD